MKILILLMALIALIVALILGIAIGAGSQGDISFTADTLSSWVSALATVCIAMLTIVLARETLELRKIQNYQIEQARKSTIKPIISVYLKSSAVEFSFLNIHILNNGNGPAQNIHLKFKNNNSSKHEIFDYIQDNFLELAILDTGISSLAPGEHRVGFALNLIEISGKFPDQFLDYNAEVEINYQDIEGTEYSSKTVFNFSEFRGLKQAGKDPLHEMARSLEKVQKDVGKIASKV